MLQQRTIMRQKGAASQKEGFVIVCSSQLGVKVQVDSSKLSLPACVLIVILTILLFSPFHVVSPFLPSCLFIFIEIAYPVVITLCLRICVCLQS